jgi:hypothetical protein
MKTPRIRGNALTQHGLLFIAILFTPSCTSLQVPVRSYEMSPRELLFSSQNGISVGARPIVGRDRYWDLFDDNLPEFGIGAIWVQVRNETETGLDMSAVHWILAENQAGIKELDSTGVLDRYYQMRRIRLVTVEEDRKSQQNLEFVRFPITRIPSHSSEQGFLFFRIGPTKSENWIRGSTLRVERVRDSQGRTLSVQVPLANANP